MARPREFDYDEALDAAMQLFWTKGYEATSLADLTATMGLKKGSLYKAYQSKHKLFVLAIERYLERNLAEIQALLEAAPSARDGIRAFLTTFIGQFHKGVPVPRGCFAVNTVTELAPHDSEVAKILKQHFKREERILTERIRQDQEAGNISPDKDPEALAEFVIVVAMGLQTGTKGPLRGIDDTRIAEHVLTHFD